VKRKVLILSIFAFITGNCVQSNANAQSIDLYDNDVKNYNLKGNVKEIIEIQQRTSDTIKIIRYNQKGQLIYSRVLTAYDEYKYIIDEYEYKYDCEGNNSYEIGLFERKENKFDIRGNLIEHKFGITDNDFFGKWIYKYDNNNNQIERSGYIGNNFVERWKHIYNDNNQRIKELMVDADVDSAIYIMRYFEYNHNGNIIREQYISYQGNKGEWNDFFKYDENNNIVEWKRIDNEKHESIELYEYEYDEKGHWIKKKTLRNNILIELSKRVLEYWAQ